MPADPTLIFVPGSWHKPNCYDKIINLLRSEHNIKCIAITLPSTDYNPEGTFKDDVEAARDAIISETSEGRDVIVIAHSYGGMVGNSAIKGLTLPKVPSTNSSAQAPKQAQSQNSGSGYVKALILIASGFAITGLAFMDPFFGIPPPSWRVNKDTGYAELVADPREFFYHDLREDEARFRVGELTTQSLKALFEGGEHAYAGWQDVPTWYIGTIQDRGLPVMAQRMAVGMARSQGGVVYHTELESSHSPFLSMPGQVTELILEAVQAVRMPQEYETVKRGQFEAKRGSLLQNPSARLWAPITWFKFGVPLLIGRILGWCIFGTMRVRRLWK